MARLIANARISALVATMLVSTAFAAETPHWAYEGAAGPQSWGKLSPDYAMCEKGSNQSPINIQDALHTSGHPLQPNYTARSSETIINNGHTVQVNFGPGNSVVVDNTTFTLKQVHFHSPSENLIEGKSFAMEAHFVHADDEGNLLVLALMYSEGEANSTLAKLWTALPANAGPASPLAGAITPTEFLPKSLSYYRFSGSLTTPPCTEGVRWLVLKTPVSASKAQIEAFQHAVKHHNNRPVQAMNGRVVVDD
jgi:carbonic anhydrase